MDKMQEKKILNACLEQLGKIAPIKRVVPVKKRLNENSSLTDAIIDIHTETGKERFQIEIKGVLKRPLPDHLALKKRKAAHPLLLMSEYVNPSIASDLKNNNINFIDNLGNAFIHVPNSIYIERTGKKPAEGIVSKEASVFQPKGMQLLYILLTIDGALNQTVRTLADMANISKDRTATGIRDLIRKEYIVTAKKRDFRFTKKRELLEKWLSNYGDRFRPKLVLGSYKIAPSVEAKIPETLSLLFKNESDSFAIGGGLGADLLIHYYRGRTIEIFIKPNLLEKVKTELKLIPAKETNVTLLNLFSPRIIFQEYTQFPVVHPLLIYAELLYQGGNRTLKTAEMIYNTYLKKRFDET